MSKKNENKRKFDLKSAILLLLLLAVLLTASTYAWFTANRTVTVDNIDVNIAAQNGLQISANGVDWGATVTTVDLKKGYATQSGVNDTNQLPSTMEPVSTAGTVASGKMAMFYGKLDPDGNTYSLTATAEPAEVKTTDSNPTVGKYVAFDIFLKVNQDEDTVILGENSHVIFKDGTTDRGIQNAARVAFLIEGNADENAGQEVFVGKNGALSFTDSSNTGTTKTTYIWEPNSDVHTDSAVTYGNDMYKMEKHGITIQKLINAFYGKDLDSESTPIDSFTQITPSYSTGVDYTSTSTPVTAFSLKQGVTKVRIYMWIEGQDVDCENTASGSDATFKVEFRLPEVS